MDSGVPTRSFAILARSAGRRPPFVNIAFDSSRVEQAPNLLEGTMIAAKRELGAISSSFFTAACAYRHCCCPMRSWSRPAADCRNLPRPVQSGWDYGLPRVLQSAGSDIGHHPFDRRRKVLATVRDGFYPKRLISGFLRLPIADVKSLAFL